MRIRPRPTLPALAVALLTIVAMPALSADTRADAALPSQESTATGYGGAAATEHPLASQAAIDVLNAGGNAVDAAVAASAVQSVVRPFSGGPGGGGYMNIYLADTDEFAVLDHQSMAPASFDADSFIDPDTGEVYDDDIRASSGPAAAIPGQVKGWEQAVDQYGSGIPLADLLQPAIDVATNGFEADDNLIREITENAERFCIFPATAEIYLEPGCVVPQPGTVLTNPDMANALQLVADHGSSVFYNGEMADAIADTINDPQTVPDPPYTILPGDVVATDFTDYSVRETEPVSVDYRGYQVHMPRPSSAGGTTTGEALNVLEAYDLSTVPLEEAWHYYIEASRYAFVDEQHYLGDETTYDGTVPVDGLLSDGYAEAVRQHITDTATTRTLLAPGDPFPFHDDPTLEALPVDAAGREMSTVDFAGLADGSTWESLEAFTDTSAGGTGSVIDVQSETGSMVVGPDQFSYVRATSSVPEVADSEALVRFRMSDLSGDRRLRIWLRADQWERTTSPTNGYALELSTSDDTARIIRTRDGNPVHGLATFSHQRTIDWQWLRFSIEEGKLKFRIWADGDIEPRQAWTGELDDTSVGGTGTLLMSAIELTGGGASSGGFAIDQAYLTELNPTFLESPFDGASNGSTWDSTGHFVTEFGTGASEPGVGAAIDIDDEMGHIAIEGDKFSYARAEAIDTEHGDAEILVRFRADPGDDRRLRFWLRSDDWNTLVSPSHGYGVEIKTTTDPAVDNVRLLRVREGNSPFAMKGTRVEMSSGWQWLRFSVLGGGIKAKVWTDGDPEPIDWTLWRGDEEITGPGKLRIGAIESTGGGAGGEFYIDDLTVYDHDSTQRAMPDGLSSTKLSAGANELDEDASEESTIHLSTSDAAGNVVSYTHTLSFIGGNAMVVPGYGFLLNNQLSGRTPDNAPEGHPNAPRPGMRPLSTQSPTIVMKDGAPIMALGSPGGDTIVTTVLQVLIRTLDHGMSLPDAVAAPRVAQRNHSLLGFTLVEPEFTQTPEYDILRTERGHEFFTTGMVQGIGAVNAIAFLEDGRVQAVSEPTRRGGGSAMVQDG